MDASSSIVSTGVGLVTCLGASVPATWRALISPVTDHPPCDALEQPPHHPGAVAQAMSPAPERNPALERTPRFLRTAIDEALTMARMNVHSCAPTRCGAVFGTTLHGMRHGGRFLRTGDLQYLRSFLAGAVLAEALEGLPFSGPVITVSSACASGLASVSLAAMLLRAGIIDLAVAGGYDPVSEYSYAGFQALRLVTASRPRPFSHDRDGMTVGEGYGVLVLERQHDALARGVKPLANLAGVAETSDCFHLTQPAADGCGAAKALRSALSYAGVAAEEIDMITAHGTATPNNDAAEFAALRDTCGPALQDIPVTALKSRLGHTLGAAGAVELAISILAHRHHVVPPTANTGTVDSAFQGLSLVRGAGLTRPVHATATMSLGFGGSNACAVLTSGHRSRGQVARRRVETPVITGIGVIVPGCIGVDSWRAACRRGETLIIPPGGVDETAYAPLLSARRSRRMSDHAKLVLAAANNAFHDCRAPQADVFFRDAVAFVGTTHGATTFCEAYYRQVVDEGAHAANPVLFAEGVPNAAAAHLSIALGVGGGCQMVIGSRSAGLEALMLAAWRIQLGDAPCALAGAGEEYSPLLERAWTACGNRPVALASGAVMFVLESEDHATARGAHIFARIDQIGWSPDGIRERACAKRLDEAGVDLFSMAPLLDLARSLCAPAGAPFDVSAGEAGGRRCRVSVHPCSTPASSV